jgi:hypothetical protein
MIVRAKRFGDSVVPVSMSRDAITGAWGQVVYDCGCRTSTTGRRQGMWSLTRFPGYLI